MVEKSSQRIAFAERGLCFGCAHAAKQQSQPPVHIIRRTNGMLCWAALTFLSSSPPTQYLSPDDRQNDHQGPWANLDDALYR